MDNTDNISDIIIWDTGEDKVNERYHVLFNDIAFILGEDAIIDTRNIQYSSVYEIDRPWMDKKYQRVSLSDLPEPLARIIKERIE